MAKYYYDKYSTKMVLTYVNGFNPDLYPNTSDIVLDNLTGGLYHGYYFNERTNTYIGTTPIPKNSQIHANSKVYAINGDQIGAYWQAWQFTSSMMATVKYQTHLRTSNKTSYDRDRDAIQQTNLVAEDGTYPSNGVHTDDFWYVRKGVATVPTIPGVFTQPTGILEIGDTKVVSWGPSSDTAGGSINYYPEVSINNGSWTVIGGRSVPNVNYKIPEATTIKFRVRAQNDVGYSAYRESPLFTVSKPTYYWSKYNSISIPYYELSNPKAGQMNFHFHNNEKVFSGYDIDRDSGALIGTGEVVIVNHNTKPPIGYYRIVGVNNLYKVISVRSTVSQDLWDATIEYFTTVNNPKFQKGSLVQSNITAIEGTYPTDGKHTDGYWYVRGSRVNQTIAPPGPFSSPPANAVLEAGMKNISIVFEASPAPNIANYAVYYRYNEDSWVSLGSASNSTSRTFPEITSDKTKKTIQFRVHAWDKQNVLSDSIYSEPFVIQHNKIPTLTLETENNKTLYEKDTFTIKGSAVEPDVGDVLIVYYRLNGGTARGIETKLSDGSAIPFNEQLLFKSGQLYKGETEITGKLTEGTAHTLEVWAADNQGGESEIERRTFYVVPNRPPSLTIDPITDQSGLINVDKVKVTGESFDPDGNDVVVRYRINNGINVEIHNGPAREFSFDILLSKLKDGENSIVVEVSDTFDFKFSETIKLNKTANLTPLEQSVHRYTIVPPAGSAGGVLLWIQRDETQPVAVEISMTNGTEPEQFVPMIWNDEDTKDDPKPAPISPGIVEDFLKFRSDIPAEKIAIKLSWTGDKPILQIQGALLQ